MSGNGDCGYRAIAAARAKAKEKKTLSSDEARAQEDARYTCPEPSEGSSVPMPWLNKKSNPLVI